MSATWIPYLLRVRRRWRRVLGLPPEKPGLVLRLDDGDGAVGWGDLAPLAAVHGERRHDHRLGEVARAPRAAAELGALSRCERFDEVVARLDGAAWARHPAVRFAAESAWLGLDRARRGDPRDLAGMPRVRDAVPVNALIAAAPEAVEAFLAREDAATFSAIKVKVGRRPAAIERTGLLRLFDAIGSTVAVRLDANRAFDPASASAFLDGLPLERIESVEEPLHEPSELAAWCAATGVRIALDETLREERGADLANETFVASWIVKPGAVGVSETLRIAARADRAKKRVILSSALESGLGLAFQARLAMHLPSAHGAMGLATGEVFRNDPLLAAPLVERGCIDLERCVGAPARAWLDAPATIVPVLHRARPRPSENEQHAPILPASRGRSVVAFENVAPSSLVASLARAADPRAPFVPLFVDPRWPAARRHDVLAMAGATHVLSPRGLECVGTGRPLADPRIDTLLSTSGTSGAPRLVAHTWAQHAEAAWAALARLGLRPGARWLLSLPLHHIGGLAIAHRAGLGDLVLIAPDPAEPFGAAVARLAPDVVSVVPTQLRRALDDPEACAALARADLVLLGGAPAPGALRRRALDAGISLVVTYGMTETVAFVATARGDDAAMDDIPASLLPNAEVRIGSDGEIVLRTPSLALGTVDAGGLTPIADGEGWFSTGDRGRLTADGRLVVLGRADRVFQSGGVNVQPEQVEAVVGAWPEVEAVAVLARPDEEWGARAVAIVALRRPCPAAELRARARDDLAPAERPVAWLAWPESPPPTAKVPYAALAAWLASDPQPLP